MWRAVVSDADVAGESGWGGVLDAVDVSLMTVAMPDGDLIAEEGVADDGASVEGDEDVAFAVTSRSVGI